MSQPATLRYSSRVLANQSSSQLANDTLSDVDSEQGQNDKEGTQSLAPYNQQQPQAPARVPLRQSRIKSDPKPKSKKESLKIHVELDLEAEVDLYARVKGDITIGLL